MDCMDRRTRCRMLPLYRGPVRRTSFKGAVKDGKGATFYPRCQGGKNSLVCGNDNPSVGVLRGREKKNPAADAG